MEITERDRIVRLIIAVREAGEWAGWAGNPGPAQHCATLGLLAIEAAMRGAWPIAHAHLFAASLTEKGFRQRWDANGYAIAAKIAEGNGGE